MIDLSYGGNGIFLADICKCVPPGITPAKTHNQLAGMGRYMCKLILQHFVCINHLFFSPPQIYAAFT